MADTAPGGVQCLVEASMSKARTGHDRPLDRDKTLAESMHKASAGMYTWRLLDSSEPSPSRRRSAEENPQAPLHIDTHQGITIDMMMALWTTCRVTIVAVFRHPVCTRQGHRLAHWAAVPDTAPGGVQFW